MMAKDIFSIFFACFVGKYFTLLSISVGLYLVS